MNPSPEQKLAKLTTFKSEFEQFISEDNFKIEQFQIQETDSINYINSSSHFLSEIKQIKIKNIKDKIHIDIQRTQNSILNYQEIIQNINVIISNLEDEITNQSNQFEQSQQNIENQEETKINNQEYEVNQEQYQEKVAEKENYEENLENLEEQEYKLQNNTVQQNIDENQENIMSQIISNSTNEISNENQQDKIILGTTQNNSNSNNNDDAFLLKKEKQKQILKEIKGEINYCKKRIEYILIEKQENNDDNNIYFQNHLKSFEDWILNLNDDVKNEIHDEIEYQRSECNYFEQEIQSPYIKKYLNLNEQEYIWKKKKMILKMFFYDINNNIFINIKNINVINNEIYCNYYIEKIYNYIAYKYGYDDYKALYLNQDEFEQVQQKSLESAIKESALNLFGFGEIEWNTIKEYLKQN